MPKRDFREDWQAVADRHVPPVLTGKFIALIVKQWGNENTDWRIERTLKALRHYKAFSQTSWQKPAPSIVEKHLSRFLTRLHGLVPGDTDAAVKLIHNAENGPRQLADAIKLSAAKLRVSERDHWVTLQSMLERIDVAVREDRMEDTSRFIAALPNFVQRIIDSLRVKEKGAKRIDQPRLLLIKDLNRAWHGHDEELWFHGEGTLDKPKIEFFIACFYLAGEVLNADHVKRHWKAYLKEFRPK